jgi:uncharacterized protein YcnI
MNKTKTITDNEKKIADGLAEVYTKLANLAAETYQDNQITGDNLKAINSLVNLVRVSVMGQFYEEGKVEMAQVLERAVREIEEIQEA